MRFNRNIYMRLYHIAFFMPEFSNDYNNGEKNDPPSTSIPIYENEEAPLLKAFLSSMKITDFEKQLFEVCINVYNSLSQIFTIYFSSFDSRLEDDPAGFYKSIPQDAISKETIKEKSLGLFSSLKPACFFYCNFNPSYWLYSFSVIIHKNKKQLSFLKYVKNELYTYFVNRPIRKEASLYNNLEDLSTSIQNFIKSEKNLDALSSQDYLNIIDKIVVDSIDLTNDLVSGLQTPKALTPGEKNRRTAISEKQNKRFSGRQKIVQEHISRIKSESCSKKMSIRKYCREVYFPTHESELVSLNIKSPRTLENSCCKNHKPNKHRSAFSNRAYLNPAYPDSFKQTIRDILYDLERDRRSSSKQKK